MHIQFADWYQITEIKPDKERLQVHWAATSEISERILAEKDFALKCFQKYFRPEGDHDDEIFRIVKKHDPTFLLQSGTIVLKVLTGAALTISLEHEGSPSDVIALSLRCSGPNRDGCDPLFKSLHETANAYLDKRSRHLREIVHARPKGVNLPKLQATAVELLASNDANQHLEATKSLQKAFNNLRSDVDKLRNANQRLLDFAENAYTALTSRSKLASLEEEVNILWWLFSERSRDLGCPFVELEPGSVPIIAGKELADLTRIVPGPRSAPFVLKKLLGSNSAQELNLDDCFTGVPKEWFESEVLSSAFEPVAMPLHAAISKWGNNEELDYGGGTTQLELAEQIYHETLLLRLLTEETAE